MSTVRLTVAQALVRFLANQYSERDGIAAAADPGLLRHLRARQRRRGRAGAAGGARHRIGRPAVLPGPQRAGHGARLRRVRQDPEPAAGPGLHGVDRAGVGEHAHRCGAWPPPTGCRCCCWPATSSPPGPAARCCRSWNCPAGTTSRSTTRSGRCPGSSTGCGGPSSCRRPCWARCGCSPTRPRPVRSPWPCRRMCRPRRHDWPEELFAERVWHVPRPVPEPAALARAVAAIRSARRPLLISGGGVIYSEATEALRRFAEATGIPVADTQAGKGGIRWDHPQAVGGVGSTGSPVANALARRRRPGDRGRHPVQRLHHRVADRVPEPGGAVRQPQRHTRWTRPNTPASCWSPTPGRAWRRSTDALAGYRVDAAYTAAHRQHLDRWNKVVDKAYHLGPRAAARADRGARRAERDRRPGRHHRAGRRVDAG